MNTIRERFNAKWQPHPRRGCWMWTGARSQGIYGSLTVNDRTVQAHRVSWELNNGLIPENAHVLHRCDTPACVNPDHLFLGTHTDNMRDRKAKGRARNGFESRTHCLRGHRFDAANTARDHRGHRRCRACGLIHSRINHKRERANAYEAATGRKLP